MNNERILIDFPSGCIRDWIGKAMLAMACRVME